MTRREARHLVRECVLRGAEAPREREPRHSHCTHTHCAAAGRRAQGVQRSLEKAALWLRKAALTLEQPRLILAALEHGANATVVDALFPPQLEASA